MIMIWVSVCNNNEQGECKCVLCCEQRTHSYAKPPAEENIQRWAGFGIKEREKKQNETVNLQHSENVKQNGVSSKCQSRAGVYVMF